MEGKETVLPRHVILVDDDSDVRLHLSDLLTQMGYAVETVGEPALILRRSRWPAPCVVLLDMRMPGLDGLEVQHGLAKVARHVPIVFMSGESLPQEIVHGLKRGAVDFLIKPFGLPQLSDALAAAFGRAEEWQRAEQRREILRSRHAELSPKEKLVLPLLLQGHSNKSLGECLSIQAGTVKKHRASIYEKFLVSELSQLIALFEGVGHPDGLWE